MRPRRAAAPVSPPVSDGRALARSEGPTVSAAWGDCAAKLSSPRHLHDEQPTVEAANDPFADVLTLTEASSVLSGGFSARGRWALRFPGARAIKLVAIAKGACHLRIDGQKRALRLDAGDVVFLPSPRGFVLGSDLSALTEDARLVRAGLATVGDGRGPEHVVFSGLVTPHPASGDLLARLLPAMVHVRGASSESAAVHETLAQIVEERRSGRPGSAIASALLAQLLFVRAMRAHLAGAQALPAGWIRALRDERIAPALRLLHRAPGEEHTLGELAKACAMSRTSFATHFKSVAGVAPLAYLARWRMLLAQRALRETDETIAEIASAVGYGSESAFSNAFKRTTGHAPRHYREAIRAAG